MNLKEYKELLIATNEQILPEIYKKLENKYEDVIFEKYIIDGGSKKFFKEIYPQVKTMLSQMLNNLRIREEILDMGWVINYDKITKTDMDKLASNITEVIVAEMLHGENYSYKDLMSMAGHHTITPKHKKQTNMPRLNVRSMF